MSDKALRAIILAMYLATFYFSGVGTVQVLGLL
jgi:hypothetical protein